MEDTVTTYRITVDYSQADPAHRVKPLNGVNKGPLRMYRYNLATEAGFAVNYWLLYALTGITSVRTHDSMLDVAHIFRGSSGTWPDGVQEIEMGVVATDAYLAQFVEIPFSTPAIASAAFQDAAWVAQGNGTQPFVFNHTNLQAPFNNTGTPRLGDCWLFWRPTDLTAAMDHGANFNYIDSLAEESYRMISAAGMEVYFRLGESYHGPSYMGVDEIDAVDGKLLYGMAASQIVAHLAESAGDPGTPLYPGFVEIINEPDQSGYIGPHDQPPSSDQGDGTWSSVDPDKLDRWCADFAELFNHCVAELTARGIPPGIIGSPGVTGGGARVLAAFHEGNGPVDCSVDQLFRELFDQDPSSLNFLAFHWYGDGAEMSPGTTALEVATGFPGEIRAISQAMRSLAAEFGPDLPVHVNEWNIAGLRPTPSVDVNNARTGSFGAAFVSLGLTTMQHPDLGIERAHLYPACDENAGHFYWGPSAGGGLNVFHVRPSAFAMRLYSGLEDDIWVPVRFSLGIELGITLEPYDGWLFPEGPGDVFDAIEQGFDVVALATQGEDSEGEQRFSVVLTNLSDEDRSVVLRYQGIPQGVCTLRTKQVHRGVPGILDVEVPGDATYQPYVFPTLGGAIGAFWTFANIDLNPDPSELGETVSVDGSGEAEIEVQLQPHGVMRVDLVDRPEVESPKGDFPFGSGGDDASSADLGHVDAHSEPANVSRLDNTSWWGYPLERHIPAGLRIPDVLREQLDIQAEQETTVDREEVGLQPDAGVQERYRACHRQMQAWMEDSGYDADAQVSRSFRQYFIHKVVDGRAPAELDVYDWYAWFVGHQGMR
jgi:hypothetical protein